MDWPITTAVVFLHPGLLITLLPDTPAKHLLWLHVLAMHLGRSTG